MSCPLRFTGNAARRLSNHGKCFLCAASAVRFASKGPADHSRTGRDQVNANRGHTCQANAANLLRQKSTLGLSRSRVLLNNKGPQRFTLTLSCTTWLFLRLITSVLICGHYSTQL